MPEVIHPNLIVISQLDIHDLDSCEDIIADDFVWHYFNPKLPDVAGDYRGIAGLKEFFAKLREITNGVFQVNPVDARPVGGELVVVHARNRLSLPQSDGGKIEFDAVVVWRIVNGKIAEAWDIPETDSVRKVD